MYKLFNQRSELRNPVDTPHSEKAENHRGLYLVHQNESAYQRQIKIKGI